LDCPLFEKKIKITEAKTEFENYAGTYEIKKSELLEKEFSSIKENLTEKKEEADVLIINTSTKEAPLYIHEFIRPIADICEKTGNTWRIVEIENVPKNIKEKKIIISGTALKDNQFLEYKKNIDKLVNLKKPILGICAGAELLLPKNVELEEILEIGPQIVEELNEDPLTSNLDGKECYFLHQLGIRAIPLNSDLKALLATKKGIAAFKYSNKEIYGFQFHPEVSQKQVIKDFLRMNN